MTTRVISLMVAVMLMTPATALAQGSDECVIGEEVLTQTYGPTILTPIKGPCDPPDDPPDGRLPFTGAETGLVGLAGMALLGFGIALRRLR